MQGWLFLKCTVCGARVEIARMDGTVSVTNASEFLLKHMKCPGDAGVISEKNFEG